MHGQPVPAGRDEKDLAQSEVAEEEWGPLSSRSSRSLLSWTGSKATTLQSLLHQVFTSVISLAARAMFI